MHREVGVSVTADLVPARHDGFHELRMGARGHPEDEEGRAYPELIEQLEHRCALTRERRARGRPRSCADAPAHELMPILEVDAQQQRLAASARKGPWLEASVPYRLSPRFANLRRHQRKEVVRLSDSSLRDPGGVRPLGRRGLASQSGDQP